MSVIIKDFHPQTIAKAFLQHRGPFLGAVGDLIYQYQHKYGYWKLLGFEELAIQVQYLTELGWKSISVDPDGNETHTRLRQTPRQVDAVVRTVLRTPIEKFKPGVGISTQNGFLTPSGFKQHSPENMSARYIELDYNPIAGCPKFNQMLREIFARDLPEYATEKIKIIQKFVGACLLGLAPQFSKAMFWIGTGANGKTTLQEVIEALFKGRCTAISPKLWHKEYYAAALMHSDLNMVSELPESNAFESEAFKAVITGDAIQGRNVREKPFKFNPTAGHIFAANELPPSSDMSEGFQRRVIVMPFTQDFRKMGNATKDDIKGPILREEMEGMLNWAYQGAKMILKEGWNIGIWHSQGLLDWKAESNPVTVFVEQTLKIGEGLTSAFHLYEDYQHWCWLQNIPKLSSIAFGKKLTAMSIEKQKSNGIIYYKVKLMPRAEWAAIKARRERQGKDNGAN